MGRDLARERRLDPRHQQLIVEFLQARDDVARAEGLDWFPRPRWPTLYTALEALDPEAECFLEDEIEKAQGELGEARERGDAARHEAAWEAQAVEPDTCLSGDAMDAAYTGQFVWLYHGTSTELLPEISREGLLASPPVRTWGSTPGFVYLTSDCWHALDFYASAAAERHGGRPVLLRVAVPWDELLPDPDDADLRCGEKQFVLKRDLRPWEIKEINGETMEARRSVHPNPRPIDVVVRHVDTRGRAGDAEHVYMLLAGDLESNEAWGHMDVTVFRERAHVDWVEVKPDHRRKGVATAMYAKLDAWAEDEGVEVEHGMLTEEGASLTEALGRGVAHPS